MSLNTAVQVRVHVEERLSQLRLDVFERPPSDWAAFKQMLGTYQALKELQAELTPRPNPEDER